MTTDEDIAKVKENISEEKKIMGEFNHLSTYLENAESKQEKMMIESQIEKLRISMKNANDKLLKNLEGTSTTAPLIRTIEPRVVQQRAIQQQETPTQLKEEKKANARSIGKLSELDKDILRRMKKERGKVEKKVEKKTDSYVKLANKLFSKTAMSMIKQKAFKKIGRDLIMANMDSNIVSYVSKMFLSTSIAFGISFIIFIFLMIFNINSTIPIISIVTENFFVHLLKIFWIPLVIPIGTFFFLYTYPSLEKKSLGSKIDLELPFAAIHMAAISGSMIDPTKIFSIIASTKEYPNLEKEFNKLINEINVYGYDLVTALKDLALNSPSAKLSELLNGLATTITSGGSLYEFFEKRSQSLLFEYRLDKEKATKAAETFMDIYISVVIAAPMIFMLILIMMKVSGLGISLSTSTITLLVVGGVSLVNIFFLMFLQLKQQSTA
jgi:hypothetical protein